MNMGISRYLAYDWKPENVGELNSAACGKSGIMLRMELVMIEAGVMRHDFTKEFTHTTALTLCLFPPCL